MPGEVPQVASSPLQKTPGWFKLGLGLAMGIAMAVFSHPLAPILGTLLWLTLQALAKHNPWHTMRACWPALPFVAAVGMTHFLSGDTVSGLLLAWRLCLLLWVAHVVTVCTPSRETIHFLEQILRPLPLERLGFSSRDVALMLIISMRFLPLLQMELSSLLKAQRARAFSPRRLSWKARIRYLALLGPTVLEGVFRRADQISRALRARAYVPGSPSPRHS